MSHISYDPLGGKSTFLNILPITIPPIPSKVTDKDGNKISLWDAHDDQGGWNVGIRGVVENSDGTTTELKDLTAMEIKALKRTHERISGSYRRDEKIALEASV